MKKITKIVVTSLCMACSLTAGAMALADEENVPGNLILSLFLQYKISTFASLLK